MNIVNRSKYSQNRPVETKIIGKLIKTGLFSKVGSAFRTDKLKLNDTRYFVIVVSAGLGKEKMRWFHVPEGISVDNLGFFKPRATNAILRPGNYIREITLEALFEEAPEEIVGKLVFHLNQLPR